MSFRLFIYYCAAWGAASAYFGWILGRFIEGDSALGGAAARPVAGSVPRPRPGPGGRPGQRRPAQPATLALRLTLAVLVGAVGGLIGGFLGQVLLLANEWSLLVVPGWTLTGVLIGAAPAAYDYLAAVLRNEDRRGVNRKLRNGLIGGTIGGLVGGVLSVYLHGAWQGCFRTPTPKTCGRRPPRLRGPGACIGLTVPLAQVILREAWLRVESGFRPGRQLLLTRPETTIGRAESCDLGLFGDAGVEKMHARIVARAITGC